LGTAYIIHREIVKAPVESLVLNLKVGQIPVTFAHPGNDDDILWMKQNQPTFGSTCVPRIIAESFRLAEDDVDSRFPVQEISTGIPFLIVPLKTLSAVKRTKPDWDRFIELTGGNFPRAVLFLSPETYHPQNQLNVRVFVDEYGVPEDPATGSGNGCLAAYLTKYLYFGKSGIDIRVEQGYEVKRPSLLLLRAAEKNGNIEVNVGGKVVMVARGELV
jgi:trans-2,3-dihydro-3-hydroxyanthranilate isomerase